MNTFEVGVGAAAALDVYGQSQVNKTFEAADAARLWYAQTGQMTDDGYNAIIQANYLAARGKRHQSALAGPGNAIFGLGVAVLLFFALCFLIAGAGLLFGIGQGY